MNTVATYVEVAVALPVYQKFTYSVPENFSRPVSVGIRVLVPFGQRRVTGYVLGDGRGIDQKEIKAILDILDEKPIFPSDMIPFFNWIADYYKHPIGDVIKNALPGGLNLYDYAAAAITDEGEAALSSTASLPAEKEVLTLLRAGSRRLRHIFKKESGHVTAALINSLEKKGWITITRELRGANTKSKQERFVALTDTGIAVERLSKPRKKIIDALQARGEISLKQLKEVVPTATALIRAMAKDGVVRIRNRRVYRDPFGDAIAPDVEPDLTDEQQQVVDSVFDALQDGFSCFILKGVTGSGKTEVYMRVAAEVLERGQTALILVPEIALITQLERRFRARFGERIAILHSGISAGERFDQWSRILNREAVIVIGARSALFAPLIDIGVVIVDEEHDTSYKQESGLRYNARDLAVVRAKQNNCVALLGSATPSIQSYHNAVNGKFHELSLTKRVEDRPMPCIQIVDLRLSRDARGFERFITPELRRAMQETLHHGEQVLLFLNRRGYASYPICGACGEPFRCKHCDISLTLHQKANAYRCHYCGYSRAAVSTCDKCGSDKIKRLGLGTEKVEETVQALFPKARVARMDRDTTKRKGAILRILKGLQDKSIDILVGTQMVAKGHDFPNITLVGIICADLSLSFPDFRAGERTFQILAQVSGRAGRGDTPGRVILQTYNPDHFSILAAQAQDADMFYNKEIAFRKSLRYPPFSRMIQLKISGSDKQRTESRAISLGDICRSLKAAHGSDYETIEIMGPLEASLARIGRLYRWQIILKGLSTAKLHQFVGSLLAEHGPIFTGRNVKVVIDVDPYLMM